jgi:hypothetical protein
MLQDLGLIHQVDLHYVTTMLLGGNADSKKVVCRDAGRMTSQGKHSTHLTSDAAGNCSHRQHAVTARRTL